MRIISDVFLLFATDNLTNVPIAPNGNFQISTVFSPTDLALASLPPSTITKVIFKPHNSNIWEIISDVNTTISFNRTGTYAIAATIERDIVSPSISIAFSQATDNLGITFADNTSGINWGNTQILVNGKMVEYLRIGTNNTINLPILSLKTLPEGTYFVQVLTYDFATNFASKEQIFPCEYKSKIVSFEGRIDSPIYEKALKSLETNAKLPLTKPVYLKSGGNILLGPGFETKDNVFKAEIGGCSN